MDTESHKKLCLLKFLWNNHVNFLQVLPFAQEDILETSSSLQSSSGEFGHGALSLAACVCGLCTGSQSLISGPEPPSVSGIFFLGLMSLSTGVPLEEAHC